MHWANDNWEKSLSDRDHRGYLIVAANTQHVDYIKCATKLAESIKFWHPNESICLLTDSSCHAIDNIFDHVKIFPFGDKSADSNWKLENDWQIWSASPYKHTIKLEADMLVTSSIGHWWDILKNHDVFVSCHARDFTGQITHDRTYRKVFDHNDLPDVYNAITYWRTSRLAREFFRLVRVIFENWNEYKKILKFADDVPTTDLVYGIAIKIMGVEHILMPWATEISITHMKKHINPIQNSDWTKELVWEFDLDRLRINTITQTGIFHYHIKSWVDKIEKFTRNH